MQAVAGAAMSIAILMNAPTGFLDFLLRMPWQHLGTVLPQCALCSSICFLIASRAGLSHVWCLQAATAVLQAKFRSRLSVRAELDVIHAEAFCSAEAMLSAWQA